jgi:hypothetical protein
MVKFRRMAKSRRTLPVFTAVKRTSPDIAAAMQIYGLEGE